jgi:hypothetical protein
MDTRNKLVDENGLQVPCNTGKPYGQDIKYYLDSEEYEKMKMKWAQVRKRNMEIRKNDDKQIMEYVSNVKNVRRRKR